MSWSARSAGLLASVSVMSMLWGCGGDDAPGADPAIASDAGDGGIQPDSGDGGVEPDGGDGGVEPDAGDGGNQDGGELTPFTVVSTTPTGGTTGVALDGTIRVGFSADVDPATPLAGFWIEDSSGIRPDGTWDLLGSSLVFKPAMLLPLQSYTVTLTTLLGDGGSTLENDHTFSFTTGETTASGKRPPGLEDAPLGSVITFERQPEYALVWTEEKSADTANTYVQGVGDVVIADPNRDLNPDAVERFDEPGLTAGAKKIPVGGQFDQDPWDELMVVENLGGAVSVRLVDTTGHNQFEFVDMPSLGAPAGIVATAAVAADFDGDGRDELAIFMLTGASQSMIWRVVDLDAPSATYQIAASGFQSVGPFDNSATGPEIHAATGLVHDDGLPRAVVAWSGLDGAGSGTGAGGRWPVSLAIFDRLAGGQMNPVPEGVRSDLFTMHGDNQSEFYCPDPSLSLTAADADGDTRDEIFLGVTEHWFQQTSGSAHRCNSQGVLRYIDATTNEKPAWKNDVKGGTGDWLQIYSWHEWYPYTAWILEDRSMRRPMAMLLGGHFSGDANREEVLFQNRMYRFTGNMGIDSGWPGTLPLEVVSSSAAAVSNYLPRDLSTEYLTRDATVADMDGDGKEDVVLLRKTSAAAEGDEFSARFTIDYFDVSLAAAGAWDASLVDYHSEGLADGNDYKSRAGSPRLALVNVDADSSMLELEETKAVLSEPRIIAVLAVPPYKAGIGQNVDACSTEFGTGSGTSWTIGTSTEASIGATMGFEWEPKFNISLGVGVTIQIAKLEGELEAGAEWGFEHALGLSTQESMTYSTGPLENLVIADVDVYQSYVYRVVSDADLDPAAIGKRMTVNIPIGRRRSAVSQDFFNRFNAGGFQIDASILGNVPGEPTSYLNFSEADALLGQHHTLIGLGTAAHLLEPPASAAASASWGYEAAADVTSGFSFGTYVTASAKACTPDASGLNPSVCVGVTGGVSRSYAHSTTFGRSTSFGATLGGIPGDEWLDNVYQAGLIAYRVTIEPSSDPVDPNDPELANIFPGRQHFIVVNYYVP